MMRIAGVRGDPHCASQPLPNEGSQAISMGVNWRSLASNFGDFGDFDANFPEFFHHLDSNYTSESDVYVNYDIKR